MRSWGTFMWKDLKDRESVTKCTRSPDSYFVMLLWNELYKKKKEEKVDMEYVSCTVFLYFCFLVIIFICASSLLKYRLLVKCWFFSYYLLIKHGNCKNFLTTSKLLRKRYSAADTIRQIKWFMCKILNIKIRMCLVC